MNTTDLSQLLSGLNAGQFNDRLARLERSLHQLEIINATTLALLHKMFASPIPESVPSPEVTKLPRAPKVGKEQQ